MFVRVERHVFNYNYIAGAVRKKGHLVVGMGNQMPDERFHSSGI